MNIYFTKILSQLIYPLNLSLLLGVLAGFLFWLRWRRLAGLCLAVSISWLWLCSIPVFSDVLRGSLERIHLPSSIETLPRTDAILVLGGGVEAPLPPQNTPNLLAAADRVWYAARLYKAGKAPWVIVTGGELPWLGKTKSEADAMSELLKDFGVPDSAILRETESLNTYQNAHFSKPILEENSIQSVLLVTSALHTPRALAIFHTAGILAIPAPTDFEVLNHPNTLLRWLPDAKALEGSTRAIKEYLGFSVYKMRGWID
jgi:uncharacterized SAM-binding protein YcdF (DUF218 family)